MAKIRFHPFFVIYVFICLYFNWLNSIFFYIVSVILHEYGHYFVAKMLGYNSQGIVFNLYGAGLKNNGCYIRKHDILISLAGPLVNLILILLIVCFWWFFPTTYFYTYEFLKTNLIVMLFNLTPIYPLDGGRVIVALLSKYLNRKYIIKINYIISLVIGVLLVILFVISLFLTINFSFLFMGVFLLINNLAYEKNSYFEKFKALLKTNKRPCEMKIFKVDNLNKSELLKHISPNFYSVFVKFNGDNKKVLFEDDLLK